MKGKHAQSNAKKKSNVKSGKKRRANIEELEKIKKFDMVKNTIEEKEKIQKQDDDFDMLGIYGVKKRQEEKKINSQKRQSGNSTISKSSNMQRKNVKKETKNKKANSKLLTNIILLILIVIFLYSGYQVFLWLKSDAEMAKLEEGLFSEVLIEEDNEDGEKTESIDFEKLQKINPDVFAWIKIDNTNINYPILQGSTDEYYLRKDINGKYNIAGSIFVDATTSKEFSDDNTVIYGHNMKNGKMFADLLKIYNGDLGNNVEIKIFTKEGLYKYKVISTYVVEPNLSLVEKNFSEETKQEYINNAIEKSNIKFEDQTSEIESNLITLITCDKINTSRVVVHCVKIDETE